ncbi:hypothetical protein PoB_003116600 [Plakobranchus ocellatus]|uniref:Uncharacterized protein n=1 Tax=Plakobranchus ocellatus TaxID=259542 RepID=A0AAV4A0D5_9GAST|nr:hypothetical protein PoB_003116600 [Plakobranchus ocellatus]
MHDKHQTRSYWINTDSDQAMYRCNTRFIRHNKSPPAAPAQGNSGSYNPVHSDNDKINQNSHLNKDTLTQSKHSGSPPSHDLLQSHSSASTLRASTAAVPPAMTCCNLIVQLAHKKLTLKHVEIHLQYNTPIIKQNVAAASDPLQN